MAEQISPSLQVLHPLSMRPARDGDIPVRVKNSYNPNAPGTVITRSRDMSKVCETMVIFILRYIKYDQSPLLLTPSRRLC